MNSYTEFGFLKNSKNDLTGLKNRRLDVQPEQENQNDEEEDANNQHKKKINELFSTLSQILENDFSQTRQDLSSCILNIPKHLYTKREVIKCVGRKFRKIINNIDYSKRKVFEKIDEKFKDYMIQNCFLPAQKSLEVIYFEDACDCLEKDIADLLWQEQNFYNVIKVNQDIYTEIKGKITQKSFFKIMMFIKLVYENIQELYESIEEQYLKTKAEIQSVIDSRTEEIYAEIQANNLKVNKNPIKIHRTVKVLQTAFGMLPPEPQKNQYPLDKIPSLIPLDGTNKLFSGREHPVAKKLKHFMLNQHDNTIDNDDFILDTKGPTIAFKDYNFKKQQIQFNIFKNGGIQKIQKLLKRNF